MAIRFPTRFYIDDPVTLDEDSISIDYLPVKDRTRGVQFLYKNHRYLFEYQTSEDAFWQIDCEIVLVDVRKLDEPYGEGDQKLDSKGFQLVEIVKTETGVVLTRLTQIYEVDTEYWAETDLNRVLRRLFEYFQDHFEVFESEGHFLTKGDPSYQ